MVKKKQYESMDVRVRGLMIAAGALKDNISKGNTLPQGVNGSHLSDITNYSSQLKGDFASLSDEFKAGGMTLEDYVSRLNVFVSMLNAGVTDTKAIGADEIKAEYLRVKKLLAERKTTGEYVEKGKVEDPILSNQDLIKSRIYAAYKPAEDRLEKMEVIDPIFKAAKVVPLEAKKPITKSALDKAFEWLEEFNGKK